MANPFTEYQKVLASRGLGGVFQEEGPAMAPSAETMSEQKRLQDVFSRGNYPDDLMNKAFLRNLQKDAESKTIPPSGIEAAIDEVRRAGFNSGLYGPKTPLTLLEKKARQESRDAAASRIEEMPEDSSVFKDSSVFQSPLDAIAAQIAKAQSGANDSEIAQRMIEDKKKSAAESAAAEEFRAEEAKSFDDTSLTIAEGDKIAEDTFKQAMKGFLGMARGASPEKRERTLEEYKKEFAAATGVDVSGKVDKSQALMALGLGLMQNRAGKGFNVGKILNAVGQAGEKALPALEKAKNKAQTAALAAGKYALESRGSDRAKDEATEKDLMNRGKYWVYKKGSKGAEFEGFDNGEFVDLNKYELNKLMENSEFEKQYEFINASDRMAILEKRAEGVDFGDAWMDPKRISLIGGKADDVPPELQVLAASANPNYKGTIPAGFKLQETPETVVRRFGELQKSITSGAAKFETLLEKLNTGVTIPEQFLASANNILVSFGIGETSDITEAKRLLKNIAIDEATNILQESGKTLSDNDRKLVAQRVGQISWGSADLEEIKAQLRDIYYLTITKPQENLDRAINWLDQNAGISFGPSADDMPTQAELDAMNKIYGTSYTLDVFKPNGASK